jgi:chaperonin cofactor prefoldin
VNDILTILIQYGLAGVVIYLFYKLITNDLREFRESIESELKSLRRDIRELVEEIRLLRVEIRRSRGEDKV